MKSKDEQIKKLKKEICRLDKKLTIFWIIILLFGLFLAFYVAPNFNSLKQENQELRELIPTWTLNFECDWNVSDFNGLTNVHQVLNLTFDNYEGYIIYLEKIQENSALNCEVIE